MGPKHKLQIEEGISNWITILIVLGCAAPAITLNVLPRVLTMMTDGITNNQLGIVLLVTLSALGMTCVPFAMKKAENSAFWWTCLAFGIGLGLLNYSMAVGAIGKVRDDDAGTKQLVIDKAKSLKLQIDEAREARKSLPAFRPTSDEMVAAAKSAVDLAVSARDQECGKVGDNCRARVAQLTTRIEERDRVVADHALTGERRALDEKVRILESEVVSLGPIPATSDAQASRIAAYLGSFISSERVADGLIGFLSFCAEAFALGMPRVFTTALRAKVGEIPRESDGGHTPQPLLNAVRIATPPAQKSTPMPPAIPRSTPLPATRKAPSKPKASVDEFKQLQLQRAPGRIRAFELYSHYKDWSALAGKEPESFEDFDRILKGTGVKEVEESRRTYYLDIAIKRSLKAVS